MIYIVMTEYKKGKVFPRQVFSNKHLASAYAKHVGGKTSVRTIDGQFVN